MGQHVISAKRAAVKSAMDQILKRLSTSPATVYEIADDFGMTTSTVNRYIRELVKNGTVSADKIVDRKVVYVASKPSIIPQFRNNAGDFGSAMHFVHNINKVPVHHKPKLEAMLEVWPRAFMGLFKQARNVEQGKDINEELKTQTMAYFNQLRAELIVRLEMINGILGNDKWWLAEELANFPLDTTYNARAIDEAWDKVTRSLPVELEQQRESLGVDETN